MDSAKVTRNGTCVRLDEHDAGHKWAIRPVSHRSIEAAPEWQAPAQRPSGAVPKLTMPSRAHPASTPGPVPPLLVVAVSGVGMSCGFVRCVAGAVRPARLRDAEVVPAAYQIAG